MAAPRSLAGYLKPLVAVVLGLGLIAEPVLAHGPGRPCCGGARPPATGTPGTRPPMMPQNMMQGLPPGVREAVRNALSANRPGSKYSEIRQGHFLTDKDLERMRGEHFQMQMNQHRIDEAGADNVRIFVVKHGANFILAGVGFIIAGPLGAAAVGIVYNLTESATENYVKNGNADKVPHDMVAEFYAEMAGQIAGQTPIVGPVVGPPVKYFTKKNLAQLMEYEFRVDPANVDWQAGQERFGPGGGPAGWRGPIK